jgi:hypothetical protein
MTTLPWYRPQQPPVPEDEDADRSPERRRAQQAAAIRWQRADCCVADAAYRVVLPARSPGRELLLCGHHFHVNRDKLARTGASAYDADGRRVALP